jgi:hypothetical protein
MSQFILNSDSKTEVDNDGHIPYRDGVQAEAGTSFCRQIGTAISQSLRALLNFSRCNNLSLEMGWNKAGKPELSSLHLIEIWET